jgi:sucrose phosphorylase
VPSPPPDPAALRPGPQLITYPDSLGGNLPQLGRLLAGPLAGLFGGVHILPPFPSSGDRGFAPISYREIDPAFGTWDDIAAIASTHDVALDLIVNHVSRRSAEFAAYEREGPASPHANLFLPVSRVFPGREPGPDDLALLARRRPVPWSTVTVGGTTERLWSTFGPDEPSEQIDLDVSSEATRRLLVSHLERFAAAGVRMVRLDAVGYVIKRAGTSGFWVEPDIWDFLAWLRSVADRLGLVLLAEVHAPRELQQRIADAGFWVYDFVLPGLVLDALRRGSAERLADHLRTAPLRQVTALDTHDGIGIQPDLEGLLPTDDARALVAELVGRGANLSRVISTAILPDPSFDTHQVNITYRAAVGDDDAYVVARAIGLFAPGVPQVYYVGLLGGLNDTDAVARTGEGRAVNRHDFALAEIKAALEDPLVQRILRLVRFRADHASSFTGRPDVTVDRARLRIDYGPGVSLDADLAARTGLVRSGGDAFPI